MRNFNFWRWWYQDDYSDYLTSWRWKFKRWRVLRRDKTCVVCNSKKILQVHHRHYKNIFSEKMSDLVIVCHKCHPTLDELRKRENDNRRTSANGKDNN
jgi:phage terminase large subunit GpA-like protein